MFKKCCCVILLVSLLSIQGQCSNVTETEITPVGITTTEKASTTERIPTTLLDTLKQTPLQVNSEPRDFGISLFVIGTLAAIFILPIILFVALLLFVPVPSLYFPMGTLPGVPNGVLVAGRSLTSKLMNRITPETVEAFRGMMDSEVCVQRVSCEIMKASKEMNMDRWLYGVINDIPMSMSFKRKINRGAKATPYCRRFLCDPLASMWKMFT